MNTNMLTRDSWSRIREIVRRRDNGTCQYCGENAPDGEADHVLPLGRGGTDSFDNLVWCCGKCNAMKNDMTLRELLQRKVPVERHELVLSQPLSPIDPHDITLRILDQIYRGKLEVSESTYKFPDGENIKFTEIDEIHSSLDFMLDLSDEQGRESDAILDEVCERYRLTKPEAILLAFLSGLEMKYRETLAGKKQRKSRRW